MFFRICRWGIKKYFKNFLPQFSLGRRHYRTKFLEQKMFVVRWKVPISSYFIFIVPNFALKFKTLKFKFSVLANQCFFKNFSYNNIIINLIGTFQHMENIFCSKNFVLQCLLLSENCCKSCGMNYRIKNVGNYNLFMSDSRHISICCQAKNEHYNLYLSPTNRWVLRK